MSPFLLSGSFRRLGFSGHQVLSTVISDYPPTGPPASPLCHVDPRTTQNRVRQWLMKTVCWLASLAACEPVSASSNRSPPQSVLCHAWVHVTETFQGKLTVIELSGSAHVIQIVARITDKWAHKFLQKRIWATEKSRAERVFSPISGHPHSVRQLGEGLYFLTILETRFMYLAHFYFFKCGRLIRWFSVVSQMFTF